MYVYTKSNPMVEIVTTLLYVEPTFVPLDAEDALVKKSLTTYKKPILTIDMTD